MVIKGINVVFAYVSNMERSKRFYSERLGLGKPAIDTETWVEWSLPQGGNFAIAKGGPDHVEGANPARSTIRYSFVVDSLDASYEELRRNFIPVHRPPKEGPGLEFCEAQDPDGNLIRLVELKEKKKV